MRIAISGSACQGKTTLINDFIKEWPMYKTPSESYRAALKKGNYPHSKNCNKEGQRAILNFILEELKKYERTDNVIFDRCALDNIVYSLWSYGKEASDIDKDFIDECLPLIRESMKYLDIIFYIPITSAAPVPIVPNGVRETDPEYIQEIDNIFKALQYQYTKGECAFIPYDDCPAIIEVFGNPQQRIQIIKQYLGSDGNIIGGDAESQGEVFKDLSMIEQFLKEQKNALDSERFEKDQRAALIDFYTDIRDKRKKKQKK